MKDKITEEIEKLKESQKNYKKNIKTIEYMLYNERGYVFDIPYNEDVIVMCSGGLDSASMIDIVIKELNVKVHPLYFRRGSKNQKYEEESFDFFTDFYKKRYPDNIKDSGKIDCLIPPKELKDNIPKLRQLTKGHPMRNATMQNLAVMYVVALNNEMKSNIRTIFVGSVGEDEGTIESRPESGLLSLRSQTLNTCINMGEWYWQITSPLTEPFMRKNPLLKTDLIKYANDNGIPLEKTRSCFSDSKIADGTCNACRTRLHAFDYLGIKDPAEYNKC